VATRTPCSRLAPEAHRGSDSTEVLSVSLKRVVLGSIDDVCRFYPIVIEQELAVLLDKSVPAMRIAARKMESLDKFRPDRLRCESFPAALGTHLNGAALLGIGLKHLRSVIFELASTTYDVLSEQYEGGDGCDDGVPPRTSDGGCAYVLRSKAEAGTLKPCVIRFTLKPTAKRPNGQSPGFH
jgi:hypothetical protein